MPRIGSPFFRAHLSHVASIYDARADYAELLALQLPEATPISLSTLFLRLGDNKYVLTSSELIAMGWFARHFIELVVENCTKFDDKYPGAARDNETVAATLALLEPLKDFTWLDDAHWEQAAKYLNLPTTIEKDAITLEKRKPASPRYLQHSHLLTRSTDKSPAKQSWKARDSGTAQKEARPKPGILTRLAAEKDARPRTSIQTRAVASKVPAKRKANVELGNQPKKSRLVPQKPAAPAPNQSSKGNDEATASNSDDEDSASEFDGNNDTNMQDVANNQPSTANGSSAIPNKPPANSIADLLAAAAATAHEDAAKAHLTSSEQGVGNSELVNILVRSGGSFTPVNKTPLPELATTTAESLAFRDKSPPPTKDSQLPLTRLSPTPAAPAEIAPPAQSAVSDGQSE
ncbi:MAG: hypothetical protein M1829_002588, partial [Trizodia sp. TS-e1964]